MDFTVALNSAKRDPKRKGHIPNWLDKELLPKNSLYTKLPPLTLNASLSLLSQSASGSNFTDETTKKAGMRPKDLITPRTYRATVRRHHQVHLPDFPTGLGRNAPPWLVEFGKVDPDTFARSIKSPRIRKSGAKTDRPQLARRGSLTRLQRRMQRERDELEKKQGEDLLSGAILNDSKWWVMETPEDQSKFKKLLRVPPSKRTKADISQLLRAMTTLEDFKHMERDIVESICSFITLYTARKGELIYQTGDTQFHYVVISGEVNVVDVGPGEGASGEKVMKREETGYCFGGIDDDPKDVFVVAKMTTDLVKIGVDDYREILAKEERDRHDQLLSCLRSVVIFRSWSRAKLESLLPSFHHRRLSSNQVVQKQGQQPDDVWFVKKGQFKCVREVTLNDDLGRKSQQLLEIGVLSTHDFFGDESILFKTPHTYSVFSTCPSEAYTISKHEFIRKVLSDSAIDEILRSYREAHTASDRLTKTLFMQSEAWQRFRVGLRSHLEKERLDQKKREWGSAPT